MNGINEIDDSKLQYSKTPEGLSVAGISIHEVNPFHAQHYFLIVINAGVWMGVQIMEGLRTDNLATNDTDFEMVDFITV